MSNQHSKLVQAGRLLKTANTAPLRGIFDAQWPGEDAPRFLSVFLVLSFFRFDGESRPTHLPLTHTVSPLIA